MRNLFQTLEPNQYDADFLKSPRPIDILPNSGYNTNVNKGTRIEDELVVMAKAGNKDAFYQLQKKYKNAILAKIRIEVQNSEDIKDVEQNFWEKVWERIHEYDKKKARFSTWLFKCQLRSAIRDYRRPKDKLNKAIEDGTLYIYFNYLKILSPEDYAIICDLYVKNLDIALLKGGPPHKTLVYCLNNLLTKWNSIDEIYREFSSKTLLKISTTLFSEYIDETRIREYINEKTWSKEIDNTAEKFRYRMRMKLKDVLPMHSPKGKLNYPEELMDCVVGQTMLKDYYGENPKQNISEWAYRVKEKIKDDLIGLFRAHFFKIKGVKNGMPK